MRFAKSSKAKSSRSSENEKSFRGDRPTSQPFRSSEISTISPDENLIRGVPNEYLNAIHLKNK